MNCWPHMELCFRVDIYVGPSAPEGELRAEFAAAPVQIRVLPPIQQGDLLRDRSDLPEVVAIIDGYFHQAPAVLHKEILAALEQGVRVLGAASMGALRAAELDGFGMEGVGEIYGLYKSGRIEGDDEVALLHAGPEYAHRALTVPLVNARHNLERAREAGVISARAATMLLTAAKRLHYTRRTYEAVCQAARVPVEGLREFLRTGAVDLKRADALALAQRIAARLRGEEAWPPRAPVVLQRTKYFRVLEREYAGRRIRGCHVTERTALVYHQLLAASFPALLNRIVTRCLAVEEASQRGLLAADAELLRSKFRRSRRLSGEADYRDWLRRRDLTEAELVLTLQGRDLEARVLASYHCQRPAERLLADVAARLGVRRSDLKGPPFMQPGIPWEAPVIRELKLGGAFDRAMEAAARILEFEAKLFDGEPELRDAFDALADRSCDMIEAWAAKRWRIPRRSLKVELRRRGFLRYSEFLEAARLAHAFERRQQEPSADQGQRHPAGERKS